jgi:acyl-CoA reductase-like NAD-dependent aldehyde dehydrogenase
MAPTTNTELDFNQFFNVIEGKLTSTATTRHGIDPATEIDNPAVPVSTRDDVELAVASAKTAFEKWSSTSVAERRAAISAFADAIEANASGFAQMLTKEQGKPVRYVQFRWLLIRLDLC